MEKIDLELQEIATHKQYKNLEKFLQRFNQSDYKETFYERRLLELMLNQLDWVIKNCLGK